MGGVWYRLKQFWLSVTAAPLSDAAWAEIMRQLTPAELSIFQQYSQSEQQHGYRVMKTLQASGQYKQDLLTAALLHDVGKSRAPLSVWERSWIVLAEKMWPGKMAVWGQNEPAGRQRPFVVKAQHPEWGAQMAEAAGSSPLVVELIRRHQDELEETAVTETDQLLRLLQWADDQN